MVQVGKHAVHYVAMMIVVAAISLYGSGAAGDFKRSYEAAASGELGDAVGYATAGVRRAFRDADPGRDNRPGRTDVRYGNGQPLRIE